MNVRKIAVLLFTATLATVSALAQNGFWNIPSDFDATRQGVAKGSIDTLTYVSKTVGTKRRALVYTPPGFNKKQKYPVLYLLHGIGGDEKEWYTQGNPQQILDNLYADKKAVPMIVVFPNGRANKDDRATGNIYDQAKVQGFATFEKDLLNDLIPAVEARYPALKNRESRAIAGLSMGGGQSLNFGLGHLDRFAWVGGFSSAPNTKKAKEALPDPAKGKQLLKLLWISCGDKDGLITNSQQMHEYMVANKVPHIYRVIRGGYHDFKVWKQNLYQYAQLLFKPVDVDGLNASMMLAGVPAESNVRGARYPQVLPDGRVLHRVKAPNAQKVQLDFGKKYDMVKGADGTWEVTTDSITEGFHYYSLVIDGVSVCDPASETFYGMSRQASGFEMPFKGEDYYAVRNVPHGDVRIVRYYSSVLNTWRRFYLYVPAGYDTNSGEKYPVLYLMHGGGEDERGWATQGKTDLIMDNLIASGKAKKMLIVMPDGNVPNGGMSGNSLQLFESELKQCVIPFVEQHYRVLADAKNRAIAGLSMGGIQTLHVGIFNPQLFAYMGVFSSGWFKNSGPNEDYEYLKKTVEAFKSNNKLLWLAMGAKEDIAYENCQDMMAKFKALGITYSYSEYPGGHTWPVWRNNLYNFAPLLFK
jgi:enterochelin esterase-like enzyme